MSFVIVDRTSGNAVCEIMNDNLITKVNLKKYRAIPILEWLCSLNDKKNLFNWKTK